MKYKAALKYAVVLCAAGMTIKLLTVKQFSSPSAIDDKFAPSKNALEIRSWPKISPPPAVRRSELLDKFKAIGNGPSPKHWFPISGSDEYPNCEKSYFMDTNGRNFTIRPIFYEAMPYKGQSTAVFAWIGLPSEETLLNVKVPAMVLVHGSGGTAFKDWVELWVKKGYAAISIAVEGQTDEPLDRVQEGENRFYSSHNNPGPRRYGVYRDRNESIEDQWMFHAVADTILARSLLVGSFHEQVDPTKIGLMGTSWGGIVACTVAGMTGSSGLFSHVIPAYGCGDLAGAKSHMGNALEENTLYRTLWDPCLYLSNAMLPSLWLSWPEESKFPLEGFVKSSSLTSGPVMVSIIPNLGHGHEHIWNRPESYAFSEFIWNQNDPNTSKHCWSRQVSCELIRSKLDSLIGEAKFYSVFPFQYGQLIWSPDSNDVWAESRTWKISDAQLTTQLFNNIKDDIVNNVTAYAIIPDSAQAWMFNLYTEARGHDALVVTSMYQNVVQYSP